jgi:hypothetical protein
MKASITYEHTIQQTYLKVTLSENGGLFKNPESYSSMKIDASGLEYGSVNWIHLVHKRNPCLDLWIQY